jgi:O-antigen/teichoic acid export membrane protein
MQTLGHIKELAFESVIYGLSGAASRCVVVLLIPVYTRIFAPQEYGVMSLVTTTAALLSIFSILALDDSAHRWYWDTADINDQKTTLASWAWCHMVISLALGGLLFIVSNWLGRTLLNRDDAMVYFRLGAITLPLGVFSTVLVNWLRMKRRPWQAMIFSMCSGLSNILLAIFLVVILRWGLTGVFIAQIATAALGTVIALGLLKDWVDPRKFRWLRLKEMLAYSLPLIPAILAYGTVNVSGFYFVQYFSSLSEVALFQVGSTVAALVALGVSAFQQAWGPFALSIYKKREAKQVYANVLLVYIWLACLVSTAVSLFASELLRIFATQEYIDASRVVGLLAFGHVMIGMRYIAVIGPTIVKRIKAYGLAVTVAAFLTIGLYFLLVPLLGKEGAAVATVIGQATVPIYVFYRSQKLYPIPYRFGVAVEILLFALFLTFLGGRLFVSNLFLTIGIKALLVLVLFSTPFILRLMSFEQARHFLLSLHRGTKE